MKVHDGQSDWVTTRTSVNQDLIRKSRQKRKLNETEKKTNKRLKTDFHIAFVQSYHLHNENKKIRRRRNLSKRQEKQYQVQKSILHKLSQKYRRNSDRMFSQNFKEFDHCDLFDSLSRPLTNDQKTYLKFFISKLKKKYGSRPLQEVHVVEAPVTIYVTDINDNPPLFPNTTIHVEVQENGPKGKYFLLSN